MFRTSSAHLQEVNDVNCTCMQPLVFSFSAGDRLVHLLRADCTCFERYFRSSSGAPKLYLQLLVLFTYVFAGWCHGTSRQRQAVAQLFEALHYKLEGRVFDFRWCHWNISLT